MSNTVLPFNYKTKIGTIGLVFEVFETIAMITINENDKASLVNSSLFKVKKAINSKLVDDCIHMEMELKIKYGQNVNAVCEEIQQKVYQTIVDMTEFDKVVLDIKVVGVDF